MLLDDLEKELSFQYLGRARIREQHDAWRDNHLFLDAVAFGDLLFYRNHPVRGRVTGRVLGLVMSASHSSSGGTSARSLN